MNLCPTALFAGAFTLSLVLVNLWNRRSDRIPAHLFLGGIITLLFASLCQYGYEAVNWGMILIVPLLMLLLWITRSWSRSTPDETPVEAEINSCTSCGPTPSCDPTPPCLLS